MPSTSSSPDLQKILAGAQLPALPQSAIVLLQLSQNPDNGPAEFAVPIEADPGLTGQVLRFVNSSYFGFSREIDNIKMAITLVGVRTIKNFALWSAVFSLMPNPKCGQFDLKSLWQDSLRRALFSRAVGKALGLRDSEDLFAAALLQDMAVPLLAKDLPEDYAELLAQRDDGNVRLSDLERQRFGWDHADAAGVMARSWNLPEELARLIDAHTKIPKGTPNDTSQIGEFAVALSAQLPACSDTSWADFEVFEEAYSLHVGATISADEMLRGVDEQFAEFAPVLKLGTPADTLQSRYQAMLTSP